MTLQTGVCEGCGQLCVPDDAWTVRGRCADCRAAQYAGDELHEPLPLFGAGEAPMPGQLDIGDALDAYWQDLRDSHWPG